MVVAVIQPLFRLLCAIIRELCEPRNDAGLLVPHCLSLVQRPLIMSYLCSQIMPIKGTMEEVPDAVADRLLTQIVNEFDSDANDVTDESPTTTPGGQIDEQEDNVDINNRDEVEQAVKVYIHY